MFAFLPVLGQRKLKERSCHTICAPLLVCKGLMPHTVVTEWSVRSEGAGQRKQLRGQQTVVTSLQVPDSWVVWVTLTQFTHQINLFLLPEQTCLTVTSLVQMLVPEYSDIWRQPYCCLQTWDESSVIIFPTLTLHLLLPLE